MKISEIMEGTKNLQVSGKILNMNTFMLVLNDGSGQTFVRYSHRHLTSALNIGDYVTVQNCRAVKYSGILQITLQRNSRILVQPKLKHP